MRFQCTENHGFGWEIADTKAVPWRTFAIGLDEDMATKTTAHLNHLHGCDVMVEPYIDVLAFLSRRNLTQGT